MSAIRAGLAKYHNMSNPDLLIREIPYSCENDDSPPEELKQLLDSAVVNAPVNYYLIGVELKSV